MDFRHLEYFVEIARERNITKAAENLFVSQSAVNQYLLKLEKELGTQLFIRNKRILNLTPAGKIYLEGCRRALLVRNDTMNAIHDIVDSKASSLTVGLTPNRGLRMFTRLYPSLKKAFPKLVITPIEMDALTQQKALAAGTIDLGFMILPRHMLDSQTYIDMGEEETVLAVPANHPLCAGKVWPQEKTGALPAAELQSFADMPFALTGKNSTFRIMCDTVFQKAGFAPKILLETSNTSHIGEIAETGECCGLIPYYYADLSNPGYKCFELTTHPSWHLYIAYRSDAYLTMAGEEFIRLSKAYWQSYQLKPGKQTGPHPSESAGTE